MKCLDAVDPPPFVGIFETLCWIAFRDFARISDVDVFVVRWRHSDPGPTLDALEARALAQCGGYYLLDPERTDGFGRIGERIGEPTSSHPAFWPDAPKFLRALRRDARARHQRLISYRELASQLRENIRDQRDFDQRIAAAKRNLWSKLGSGEIVAWGRKYQRGREAGPGKGVPHIEIPLEIYMDDDCGIAEWGRIGSDPEIPLAYLRRRGGDEYADVKFKRNDVVRVWPETRESSPVDVARVDDRNPAAAVSAAENPASEIQAPPAAAANKRPRGGKSYEKQDKPLVDEMLARVESGRADSAWSAALVVAERAAGGGTTDAKAKRLLGRFQKRSGLNGSEKN